MLCKACLCIFALILMGKLGLLYRQWQREDALILAAARGDAYTMQSLLKNGVDVNATLGHRTKPGTGDTALITATRRRHGAIVELLLKYGANVNFQGTSGRTALMEAAECDDANLVRTLLQAGANVNLVAAYGGTALDAASLNSEVARLLQQAGARSGKQDDK